MANEIRIATVFSCTNGSFKETFNTGTLQFDQAAIGLSGGVYSIGTSEEAISFTDISTEGYLWLRNMDATNYVDWGPEESSAMIEMGRLEPGEFAIMRMFPTAVLRLKANTSACKVLIKVLED